MHGAAAPEPRTARRPAQGIDMKATPSKGRWIPKSFEFHESFQSWQVRSSKAIVKSWASGNLFGLSEIIITPFRIGPSVIVSASHVKPGCQEFARRQTQGRKKARLEMTEHNTESSRRGKLFYIKYDIDNEIYNKRYKDHICTKAGTSGGKQDL